MSKIHTPLEKWDIWKALAKGLEFIRTTKIDPMIRAKKININDFRNFLELYMRVFDVPTRVQCSERLMRPHISIKNDNVSKLVYFGGLNMCRLFAFDKTGTNSTLPTMIPMNKIVTAYMCIYLHYTYHIKSEYVFFDDVNEQWRTCSSDQLLYMNAIIETENMPYKIDKNHEIRDLGLNAYGMRYGFTKMNEMGIIMRTSSNII